MAVLFSGQAFQGVPILVAFPRDTISPFRFFVRLAPADENNIRLLGILRFARRVATSEPTQFYVTERFEVRANRDSFVSAPQSGYLTGDAIQLVPLYDFTTCILSDSLP